MEALYREKCIRGELVLSTFEKEFCVLTFFPRGPLASKRTVSRALSHSEKVWEIL
jgi:hypothetical protein